MRILLFLRSSINRTWVCSCILRFEFLHRLKVGRVGDDFGELFDLLELIQLRLLFFGNSRAHNLVLRLVERRDAFTWLLKRTPRPRIDNQNSLASRNSIAARKVKRKPAWLRSICVNPAPL